MTTLPDVLGYIIQEASEDDITRIYEYAKQRTRTLRNLRAAQIAPGTDVELTNISPKYLVGLEGSVLSIQGQRCTVRLTKESTDELRFASKRFYIPEGVAEYELGGVPLSSCKPVEVKS